MSTTEQSFSWGADTLSRDRGWSRRRRRSADPQSLLGLRASALLIDGLVLFVPVLVLDYVLSLVFPDHGFFIGHTGTANTNIYMLELPGLLAALALIFSYFFLYEALRGQTIGKRVKGLRVCSASGGSAGLNAISGRTVLRLIDASFFFLLGAFVAIISGRRRRRIGDWVAGTVVVRDEGAIEDRPRPAIWRLAVYPIGWILAVVLLVFALGLGTAVGEREQAFALVQSYVRAREQGNAQQACSLLTREQQREVVAIQGGSYRAANAARCPAFILGSSPNSNLRNPALEQLAAGQLVTAYTHGVVLVHSPEYPEIHLVAVREGGRLKLDVRGLEKVGFINSCSGTGQLTSSECTCAWGLLRGQGMLPDNGLTRSVRRAMVEDRARCEREPAVSTS